MVIQELFSKLGFKLDEGSFSKAQAAMGGLKSTLAAIGVSVAAGAIVKGLQNLIEHTAAAATGAAKAAQRVGMTREAYEELAHAAEETGTPVESLETGLRLLNHNIYASSIGSHQLAAGFSRLGVSTHDSAGKLRGADAVLMDVADAFKRMSDTDPRKPALAMQLFGRSGNELIPMLNKWKEGLE